MPIFALSAHTGAGLGALRQRLLQLAQELPRRAADGIFRLAVDRSFHIAGAGLVVTGTVVSGQVATGDQVRALLAGSAARVRGIHALNAVAERGSAGQRCALNLAGLSAKAAPIRRGDWIVAGNAPAPVAKLDARVRVPRGETALRHWMPVHLHLGASDVTARLATLEAETIAPGASGLVQLVLDHPIGAAYGDRLVLRDQSARRTIAGGRVIDIFPPARGRAKPARLQQLLAIEQPAPIAALTALLCASPGGVDLAQFAANRNLTADEADRLCGQMAMRTLDPGGAAWGIALAHWESLCGFGLAGLAGFHSRSPDAAGLDEARLLDGAGIRVPREVVLAIAEELVGRGAALRSGSHLRLPGHQDRFNPADAALWGKIAALLERQSSRPPSSAEIATQFQEPVKRVQGLLETAARRGMLLRVASTRFFPAPALQSLAGLAQAIASQSADHRVTAAAFREQSGLGRNLSIEVLEFFDRVGYTRRVGDNRLVLRPAAAALEKKR